MKITLICPEGFTYHSWQRVVCTGDDGLDYCGTVYSKLVACEGNTFPNDPDRPGCLQLVKCHTPPCLFVMSGESFSLSNFAALVEEAVPDAEIVFEE